jgi:hypothetical protein
VEKPILKSILDWSSLYLQQSSCIHKTNYFTLRECQSVPEKKEIDLLVKVVKVVEKDDFQLEIKVKDLSNDPYQWQMIVNKLHSSH